LKVTDPPATTSSTSPSNSATTPGPIQLAALFDQFIAAGFHSRGDGTAPIVASSLMTGTGEEFGSLSKPHH
jgi:hypothetical protein